MPCCFSVDYRILPKRYECGKIFVEQSERRVIGRVPCAHLPVVADIRRRVNHIDMREIGNYIDMPRANGDEAFKVGEEADAVTFLR